MSNLIANGIMWGAIAALIFLVYQMAILPSIRQSLRFEVFALRDELRCLAMDGVTAENDQVFIYLHDYLNFMAVSIHRFDLAGAVRVLQSLDDEGKQRVRDIVRMFEESRPEVRRVFEKSREVFVRALIFNSLFLFFVLTVFMLIMLVIKVGFHRLKDAMRKKAEEDSTYVFFNSREAAV